jgi:hypothetical protein
MDKRTKKKASYNQDVLQILKDRYGFGFDYIRKSIKGDRVGRFPEQIKKEYFILDKESKKAIIIKENKL